MKKYTASVFGSTGLIGSYLTNILIKDPSCEKVITLTRKKTDIYSPKLINKVIDLSKLNDIKESIEGSNYIYSALGTTQSQVNYNKKLYRSIDYDMTINIAKACKEKNISSFSYVSTAGADSNKKSFYLNLKGEIDDEASRIGIDSLSIFRPSLLLGERKQKRLGEKIAQLIMPLFAPLMPDNYKPIRADLVAASMHNISMQNVSGTKIYQFNDIKLNS